MAFLPAKRMGEPMIRNVFPYKLPKSKTIRKSHMDQSVNSISHVNGNWIGSGIHYRTRKFT